MRALRERRDGPKEGDLAKADARLAGVYGKNVAVPVLTLPEGAARIHLDASLRVHEHRAISAQVARDNAPKTVHAALLYDQAPVRPTRRG
jgi:hypothetical protein